MEVGVQIVHFAGTVATAYGIFERACPVIDAMYQVMGEEKCDGAKDGGLVYRVQYILQVEQ